MNKKNLVIAVSTVIMLIIILVSVVLFMKPKDEQATLNKNEEIIVEEVINTDNEMLAEGKAVNTDNEMLAEGEVVDIDYENFVSEEPVKASAGGEESFPQIYLNCDNNYDVTMAYNNQNANGVMRGLSAIGTDGEEMFGYGMTLVPSASGTLYQAEDSIHTISVDQGTFVLSENGVALTTCVQVKK